MSPPLTILVFERDESSRLGMGKLLAHEGWNVLTAATGAHALELVRERRADVLILDVESHRAADVPAVVEIRRLHRNRPILLTTAATTPRNDVFSKPVNLVAFLTRLHRLARSPRALT